MMRKKVSIQKKPVWESRFSRLSLFFVILGICGLLVHSAEQQVVAIKGGTVLTITGKTYENGMVLIKDGKIEKVGKNARVPKGASVIDASGKYVMPGIIDAMTYYGIRPFARNVPQPVTPENRIADAYYVFGDLFKGEGGIVAESELLCGGITTVYIAPGDSQLISGQGAVLKTNGKTYDSMRVRDPASIGMTIAYAPMGQYGMPAANQPTRMSSMALLRKTLMGAGEYAKKVMDYNSKSEEEKEKAAKLPRDLGNEALSKMLNREIPARIEADYVDDILAAIRIAEEFNLDLVIDSGIGAYRIRDILAKKKIPVVLGPPSHPFGFSHYDNLMEIQELEDERNAALLSEAGVKIAFGSHSLDYGGSGKATQGRWLLLDAALAVSYGLSEDTALKALTINAAEILGVDKRIGSLEKGKDADVIILSGHPLKTESLVEHVFIDGIHSYERKAGPEIQ
ncbi:MAG: amidohydrolase family protein [Candidatus Aminicenantes bacterium]|nr:amidohydrolase family protein [Candidatus Aminicenantes bacterium]